MTEKQKLPEQRAAYDYWAVTEKDPAPFGHRSSNDDQRVTTRAQQQRDRVGQRWHQQGGRRERESVGAPVSLRRIVTVPPVDPRYAGKAFVDRQRQRRERAQSSGTRGGQTQYVSRTLAQTGVRASSGRIPIVRPPLPSEQSPIPARSGQQKPTRNRFWRFLRFLTIGAIIIVLSVFLLTSNEFRIAQVRVMGTHNDALVQHIQKMEGIKGPNIFLVDVSGLTAKIAAQPEVATADLSKQWPNQLVVTIKERVPVLLWQTPKGTFSIDDQGMVIAPAANTLGASRLGTVIDISQQGQPTNTGQSATALQPGMWINKTDVAFAVAILKQLPLVTGEPANSYKLYSNGTICSSTKQTVEGGTECGGSYTIENFVAKWKAYLGSADDPNPLSNRLLELRSVLDLARQQQQNVATIDLRYGLHPVYTLQP
jgi:POTRA domain-containing FtsQ-type protein